MSHGVPPNGNYYPFFSPYGYYAYHGPWQPHGQHPLPPSLPRPQIPRSMPLMPPPATYRSPNGPNRFEQLLGEGFNVPESVIRRVRSVLPDIFQPERNPSIQLRCLGLCNELSFNECPQFVFKISSLQDTMQGEELKKTRNELTRKYFATFVLAKEICTAHSLNRLVLPLMKTISVDGHVFIAMEKIAIERQNPSFKLNVAYEQVETLKRLSGLSIDAALLPVVFAPSNFWGDRSLALIASAHSVKQIGSVPPKPHTSQSSSSEKAGEDPNKLEQKRSPKTDIPK